MDIQRELYKVIAQFPLMSDEAKWYHIETIKELLEKQQIMWTRVCLSEDPEAVKMKNKLKDQTQMLGFGTTDMTTIFKNMKDTLNKMQSQLKR